MAVIRCIPKLALAGAILFSICCAEPDPGYQLCNRFFEGVEGEYRGYMIRTQPAEDREIFFEGRKAFADLGADWVYQDEYLEMHDAGWGDYLVRYTLIMDAPASTDMKMMVETFFLHNDPHGRSCNAGKKGLLHPRRRFQRSTTGI